MRRSRGRVERHSVFPQESLCNRRFLPSPQPSPCKGEGGEGASPQPSPCKGEGAIIPQELLWRCNRSSSLCYWPLPELCAGAAGDSLMQAGYYSAILNGLLQGADALGQNITLFNHSLLHKDTHRAIRVY